MHIIKKILLFIVIIIFYFESVLCHALVQNIEKTNDRLQSIKEKGILTVASSNEIPFSYLDPKTNTITGIEGEIIKEIAKRLGINRVEMKYVPFENLLTELNNNNDIDIVSSGMYITDEREKLASFTQSLYKDSEVVVVPKVSRINSKSDLKDAVIGVPKGTLLSNLAEDWKRDKIIKDVILFDDQTTLLSAISDGKIQAGILDSAVANYSLSKDKNLFLRTLKDYVPELSGIISSAVRKSDTTLLIAINEQIDQLKANKFLYGILKENGLNQNNLV